MVIKLLRESLLLLMTILVKGWYDWLLRFTVKACGRYLLTDFGKSIGQYLCGKVEGNIFSQTYLDPLSSG